jgi:hypothetical protein
MLEEERKLERIIKVPKKHVKPENNNFVGIE